MPTDLSLTEEITKFCNNLPFSLSYVVTPLIPVLTSEPIGQIVRPS